MNWPFAISACLPTIILYTKVSHRHLAQFYCTFLSVTLSLRKRIEPLYNNISMSEASKCFYREKICWCHHCCPEDVQLEAPFVPPLSCTPKLYPFSYSWSPIFQTARLAGDGVSDRSTHCQAAAVALECNPAHRQPSVLTL